MWALVENRSGAFQEAVDGALPVHGLVSVHAVVNLRTMLDYFPPLEGTLPDNIKLTVEGNPGEEFQIWYRGDRERDPEEGDPAPIVWTGRIETNGRSTVDVPRGLLVLGRPVRRGGIPLDLHTETRAALTVRLPVE